MSACIMVIDDTPAILDLYKDILGDEGYTVVAYSYAVRDMAEVERVEPDLVIVDYIMGGERVGWDLLHILKTDPKTAHIPLIFCTAALQEIRPMRTNLEANGVRILLKPFEIDELLTLVHDALKHQNTI